jgi:hypothetical protein
VGDQLVVTLCLGVIDLPYADEPAPAKRVAKARAGKQKPKVNKSETAGAQTTGDVAEILEAKYHIVEIFYETHEEDIGEMFAESLSGTLEALLMGAPATLNPFGEATSVIDSSFKDFLSNEEMASTGTPGVPTKAALRGVNHRLKLKSGPRRPSFIDTGQYQNSFISWVENR